MTEAERNMRRLEAQVLSSKIKRYLTLVELSAREAREAICQAEELSLEAGKPVIDIAPAGLQIANGLTQPSTNQKLNARAKLKISAYQEHLSDLQAAMDKLTTELEPPGD